MKKAGRKTTCFLNVDKVSADTLSFRRNGPVRLVTSFPAGEQARNELLRNSPHTPGRAWRYDFTQRAMSSETPFWFDLSSL